MEPTCGRSDDDNAKFTACNAEWLQLSRPTSSRITASLLHDRQGVAVAAMEPTSERSGDLVPWLVISVSASPQWSRPMVGRMTNRTLSYRPTA